MLEESPTDISHSILNGPKISIQLTFTITIRTKANKMTETILEKINRSVPKAKRIYVNEVLTIIGKTMVNFSNYP